ncbi:MAG: two-component system, OmpR family, sensor histidine kinase MprB [Solirubrobacteraceae bacterium]|nr:two-component system, OmpR family, sensor histidine kinase MprB [Solirubrobacteraceae bacterium]
MSVRRRLVLLVAGAVAASVLVVSAVVYVSVRSTLRAQVDNSLKQLAPRAEQVSGPAQLSGRVTGSVTGPPLTITQSRVAGTAPPSGTRSAYFVAIPDSPFGGARGYAQVLTDTGDVLRSTQAGPTLPVTPATRDVAAGRRDAFLADEHIGSTHVRVYTVRGPANDALQVARPLTEVDASLSRLLWILLAVGAGGVALAVGFGLLVSRRTMRPVQELTETAEHVTATQDLSRRLPADPQGDELQRLGASFNTMLGALDDSRAAQRQLVADASHELRTPLTSVLTNVELLARLPDEETAERETVLVAATDQLRELDVLVEDLVDLARPEPPAHAVEDVRLDTLVGEAVQRARRHAPQCDFVLESAPVVVRGVRARIHRAVGNLLDNAVKHGPEGGPVAIRVSGNGGGLGDVVVDDRGPGIDPAERAHAFDRFWRAPDARGLPGSGLGLAIVRHVAETHGGSVDVSEAPGGGARLRMRLPLSPSS